MRIVLLKRKDVHFSKAILTTDLNSLSQLFTRAISDMENDLAKPTCTPAMRTILEGELAHFKIIIEQLDAEDKFIEGLKRIVIQ